VKPENRGRATGAYEPRLLRPSSFNAYLKSDANVLTPQEQNGLKAFIEIGCVSCHSDVRVGGASFRIEDYRKQTGSQPIDKSRFAATRRPADKYMFKVLLGRELTDREVHDLIVFLNSLTGKQPEDLVTEPVLLPQAFSAQPRVNRIQPRRQLILEFSSHTAPDMLYIGTNSRCSNFSIQPVAH
jgi:cytochrome c peroxidase